MISRFRILLFVAGVCLPSLASQAQTAPSGRISDAGSALTADQREALAKKLWTIAESDSVDLYFVSFKTMPARGVNDPVARLPKEWIGERMGAIFFYGSDDQSYVITTSPGLIKALGEERIRKLTAEIKDLETGKPLPEIVAGVADAVLASVREARAAAAGALPDRPMEWNPVGQSWEPLLAKQEKKVDELAWAANLEEDASAKSPAPSASAAPTSDRTRTPWVAIVAGGLVVLAAGGGYLVKLLHHEKVLDRDFPVPPFAGPVAKRFGALASGGHGATVDLRSKDDETA